MKKVVIIGGGACGTAAFIEMVHQAIIQKLHRELSITLIERRQKIGYGLAFGTPEKSHMLNTQADLMGIHAHEPSHFADWLASNGGKGRGDVKGDGDIGSSYTSRKLYGRYVAEEFQKALGRARENNLSVDIVHDEALDVSLGDSGVMNIFLKGTPSLRADFLLLAPGTPKPNNFGHLCGYENYLDFPWPSSRLKERVKKKDHVGILGTGLSAIDTVMTLVDSDHHGKVTLFSPDGMLPRVQPAENREIERKYFTLQHVHKNRRGQLRSPRIKDLFRLFIRDAEENEQRPIDWKILRREGRPAAELLEHDIEAAEAGGDILLNLTYSLRHETSILWNWLSTDQKGLFSKWLGRYWAVNRHAMPLYNAKKLQGLFERNSLEVIPENDEIIFEEGTQQFVITTLSGNAYRVDKLINATGSSRDLEGMDSTLIHNLLGREYLSPHPSGGALINPRSLQVISKNGGNSIYAVGHLVNGMLMDVNAVWYNVRTTARVVEEIIFKVREHEGIH